MNSPTRLPFDLGKLTDVLRTARGFLFVFALFDDVPSRERLIREVTLRVAGEVGIVRLRLSPESPVLLDQLDAGARNAARARRSSLKIAYFVDGFEAVSDESRTMLLRSFQLHREALSRTEAPIVFWMTEPNMHDIARRAPDFFSWRFSVFDFRSPDREKVRQEEFSRAVVQMLGTHAPSLIPPEELRRRIKLFEEILVRRQAEPETETVLRNIAGIHLDLGNIHYQLNEWDTALQHYQQARKILERLDDTAGVAAVLGNMGTIFDSKGEWDAALAYYQEAQNTFERLGDASNASGMLSNIGMVMSKKGNWNAALAYYQQAQEQMKQLGDMAGVATTQNNIGSVFAKRGELDAALSHFQQAREIRERLSDIAGVATTLNNIGEVLRQRGQWDEALAHYQEAGKTYERVGDTPGVASTLNNMGNILAKKGEWDIALSHFQQAREIRERLGDAAGMARTLNNIGNIYANKGELDLALAYYQQAREIRERLNDGPGLVETFWNIGWVYEKQDRIADAISSIARCVEIERRLGHPDADKHAAYLEQLRARSPKVPSVP